MSDIGSMVAELIEAGCAPDVAARVVSEAFVAGAEQAMLSRSSADVRVTERDEQAERRRERDRERQQRYRDNLRIQRDNPQTSADVTNLSLSIESKKEEEGKERKKERGERKRDVTRGHRLPDDWQPSPQDEAVADELLGGAERTKSELEKFRDHWRQQPGSRGVKLDWNAAWRNWVRRAAEYGRPGGRGPPRQENAYRQSQQETKELLNDLENFAAGRGNGRQADIRLLPGNPSVGQAGIYLGAGGDAVIVSGGSGAPRIEPSTGDTSEAEILEPVRNSRAAR